LYVTKTPREREGKWRDEERSQRLGGPPSARRVRRRKAQVILPSAPLMPEEEGKKK